MRLINKILSFLSQKKEALKQVREKIWHFREPRIKAFALHNVSFRPDQDPTNVFLIANISSGGIAFIRNKSVENLQVGSDVRGILIISEDSLPISMKVLRLSPEVVACKFNSENVSLEKLLRKYFDIEIAAMKMLKMKTEFLEPSPDGIPVCFNGQNHNKLYFIESGETVTYFEFSFFGNYIKGVKGRKLNYGNLVTSDLRQSIRYSESNLVNKSLNISDDIKNTAISFLENIEQIKSSHRSEIVEAVKKGVL